MMMGTMILCLLGLAFFVPLAAADPILITIDPTFDTDSFPVPSGYLGLSLEPINRANYYADDEIFQQLLKNLVSYGTGPFNIRWGGHTQDDDPALLEDAAWETMINLYDMLDKNVTFTIPINLRTGNSTIAQEQVQNARDQGLPAEAIYAINIGNEPDAYTYHDHKDFEPDYFKDRYWADMLEFMTGIAPVLDGWLPNNRIFSGPASSNRKEFPADKVAKWADIGKGEEGAPFTKVVTWHYYVANAKHPDEATIETLLKEDKVRQVRDHVKQYVPHAKEAGLIFRLDETNSISYSGALGVSNTMAAALWLIDHALSIMQVGAGGLNIHNAGCSPYSPVLFPGACMDNSIVEKQEKFTKMCPNSCGEEDAPAELNAPYYGMWFVQKVLRHSQHVTMLSDKASDGGNSGRLKTYILRTDKQLRVVLINKHDEGQGNMDVTLSVPGESEWGFGTVSRLLGDKLANTAEDMTLNGQQIDPLTGKIVGKFFTCKLEPQVIDGNTQYVLQLPPASATVVVIPTSAGRQKGYAQILAEGLDEDELCHIAR